MSITTIFQITKRANFHSKIQWIQSPAETTIQIRAKSIKFNYLNQIENGNQKTYGRQRWFNPGKSKSNQFDYQERKIREPLMRIRRKNNNQFGTKQSIIRLTKGIRFQREKVPKLGIGSLCPNGSLSPGEAVTATFRSRYECRTLLLLLLIRCSHSPWVVIIDQKEERIVFDMGVVYI